MNTKKTSFAAKFALNDLSGNCNTKLTLTLFDNATQITCGG